ncbi:unnamed protein product [Adineta steineri]|uniref:N-acetyltransferase domain-containing protein n=1 Tax=Adineta steineri TaxID=433720 RepID=A0A814IW55_9BILA|nr:unnamed protein product [Adineta steineri]CAF3561464.1 unnamed protein product [Adineta steineri]
MPPYGDNITDYQTLSINTNNVDRYQIRWMAEDDIETMTKIDRDTWGNTSWSSKDFFKSLNNLSWNCWILENPNSDQSILGYGLQYQLDNISHVANLTLHPSQCGRGLGGILLRHMIDYARQNDATKITLEVNTSNTRAFKLYANHGFQIVEYLERYYSDTADAYRMELLFDVIY